MNCTRTTVGNATSTGNMSDMRMKININTRILNKRQGFTPGGLFSADKQSTCTVSWSILHTMCFFVGTVRTNKVFHHECKATRPSIDYNAINHSKFKC